MARALLILFSSTHSANALDGGAQAKTDDGADLLDEERIGGQLEAFCSTGLHTEQGPKYRATELFDMPASCAAVRALQCFEPAGCSCRTLLGRSAIISTSCARRAIIFGLIMRLSQTLSDESLLPTGRIRGCNCALGGDFGA
jgi:hypothetical protein